MTKATKYYLRLTDDAEDSIYTPDTVAEAHASMKITKSENQINFATKCNKFGSGYKEFFRTYTDDLAANHCKAYDKTLNFCLSILN